MTWLGRCRVEAALAGRGLVYAPAVEALLARASPSRDPFVDRGGSEPALWSVTGAAVAAVYLRVGVAQERLDDRFEGAERRGYSVTKLLRVVDSPLFPSAGASAASGELLERASKHVPRVRAILVPDPGHLGADFAAVAARTLEANRHGFEVEFAAIRAGSHPIVPADGWPGILTKLARLDRFAARQRARRGGWVMSGRPELGRKKRRARVRSSS
jgi:hypothetical protein